VNEQSNTTRSARANCIKKKKKKKKKTGFRNEKLSITIDEEGLISSSGICRIVY
jgi:hypothetical protein